MSRTSSLQPELLRVGLSRFSGTFAGGQAANNKLELDYDHLYQHPALYTRVIDGLVALAEPHSPAFIAGIPSGATGIAECLAARLCVDQVELKKDSEKAIQYASRYDHALVKRARGPGIIVEDVINRRTSTRQALLLEDMAEKVTAVVAVFDRGLEAERVSIEQPVYSLVVCPIPAILPDDHKLWRQVA